MSGGVGFDPSAVAVRSSVGGVGDAGALGAAAGPETGVAPGGGNTRERCSSITLASFWLSSKSTEHTIDSRFSTRSRRSLFSSTSRFVSSPLPPVFASSSSRFSLSLC